MPRVKRATTAKARHKGVLASAKGYRHRRKNVYRLAKQAVMKAEEHAYASRRRKKRDFRRLWIIRINAACKQNNISYSSFVNLLNTKKIDLNRKVLSEIAQKDPKKFKEIVEKAKS